MNKTIKTRGLNPTNNRSNIKRLRCLFDVIQGYSSRLKENIINSDGNQPLPCFQVIDMKSHMLFMSVSNTHS